MSAEEFRYWQSVPRNQIDDQHAGFADSVLPVYEAGLVDLVDDHAVTEGVRLLPTPARRHQLSLTVSSPTSRTARLGRVSTVSWKTSGRW